MSSGASCPSVFSLNIFFNFHFDVIPEVPSSAVEPVSTAADTAETKSILQEGMGMQ